MDQTRLEIRMLGSFSLRWNGQELTDSDNRMRKVWLLLAFLIYRRTLATQDEISALLWGDGDEDSNNPSGALKTVLYRTRTLLDRLGDHAGKNLIIRRDGGYAWNTEIPMTLDVAEVDALRQKIPLTQDLQERLSLQQQLLSLYGGDFLPKLSSESWAIPIAAYYHRLYLETAEDMFPHLEEQEQWNRSYELASQALKIEPYSETLYCHLIRAQIALGDLDGATTSYNTMSDLLFSQFGVLPSDEARALYRKATKTTSAGATHVSGARDLLREEDAPSGALFCEYDFFRVLYQAYARSIIRSGDSIHIALFTVGGQRKQALSRRSLDCAVENLKQILIQNLRQGDAVTQCSLSQFLVMLPQANYENSCMVCDRLVRAFFRQYPHSPADLHYSVQPLEPAGMDRKS